MTKQLMKFGVVGALAAGVHFALVFLSVHFARWYPLWANVLAFLCAYPVSFFGHRLWTFVHTGPQPSIRVTAFKFFWVAIFSFVLNQGLYALLLLVGHVNYLLALLIVLVTVPPLTFISAKYWAFQK